MARKIRDRHDEKGRETYDNPDPPMLMPCRCRSDLISGPKREDGLDVDLTTGSGSGARGVSRIVLDWTWTWTTRDGDDR